ncbi:MAG: hypothetical protein HY826_02945 [Actinobacteria bacterium]|nr:hypothetical protein [Actinomycetota bacterium]
MRKALQLLAGLLLLAVPIGVMLFAPRSVGRWFSDLEQDTAVATIGAAAIISVPVVTYWTSRVLEGRRAVEAATRSKRVELYEEFFAFLGAC